jgi:hypothetical protein
MPTNVDIKYDLQSLIKPQVLDEEDLSDENYLIKMRKKAEAKLIKTKIIYKLNEGLKLSQQEKTYVRRWLS